MKAIRTIRVGVLAAATGALIPAHAALAQSQAYKDLAASWWQWALSIPASVNPLADQTGASCMIGQHGSDWFLAGTFGESTATRDCTLPADVNVFFPVANLVAFDTPNACGQDSTPIPASIYRDLAASFIDGVAELSVTLDDQPIKGIHRTVSKVFAVALPQDNLFAAACAPFGGLPAGVYSPAVDDGYYVLLNPLAAGSHTLTIHAAHPSQGFLLDITYHLTVVPVATK